MNTTLSPVTVQRFSALQGELIALVEQDCMGLSPKLEQIIRAFEFTQIELAVYRDRGYAQGRGVGQPEEDRCALACAFLTKAVLDLKTTRALIERLRADSKLRRLCGFDLRFALPSESTFSRAFEEFATSELIQRVHASMIKAILGEQIIGHISRDSTAIEARESIAPKDKAKVVPAKGKNKPGRPKKVTFAQLQSLAHWSANEARRWSKCSLSSTRLAQREQRRMRRATRSAGKATSCTLTPPAVAYPSALC